jgi:hypothetical protein
MIDPISAMAAVSSVVTMIKKAASTVDDVASLGPLLGKYFDAKHTATKAVRENKNKGGSHMAQAIEIELALKAQKDFEEQVKGLFFSTNNMDIWNNIQQRVQQMHREEAEEERRERERARKRKKEIEDAAAVIGAVLISIILLAGIITAVYFSVNNV